MDDPQTLVAVTSIIIGGLTIAVGSIGPIRARCLKRLRRVFDNLYQSMGANDT